MSPYLLREVTEETRIGELRNGSEISSQVVLGKSHCFSKLWFSRVKSEVIKAYLIEASSHTYVSYYTIKPEGKTCLPRNEMFKPDEVKRRGFSVCEQCA